MKNEKYEHEGSVLLCSNGTKISFGPNYPEGSPDNYNPDKAYVAWCRNQDFEYGFPVSRKEIEKMKNLSPEDLRLLCKPAL